MFTVPGEGVWLAEQAAWEWGDGGSDSLTFSGSRGYTAFQDWEEAVC